MNGMKPELEGDHHPTRRSSLILIFKNAFVALCKGRFTCVAWSRSPCERAWHCFPIPLLHRSGALSCWTFHKPFEIYGPSYPPGTIGIEACHQPVIHEWENSH